MRKKAKTAAPAPTPAVRQIRQAIATMTLVCAGTLLKRWKLCGRPNCRCAQDPTARHGPYYEWSRRQDGRLRHSLLSAQQAELLAQGIKNHQRILTLLARWSLETARILNVKPKTK
jgi:hypothetical protein